MLQHDISDHHMMEELLMKLASCGVAGIITFVYGCKILYYLIAMTLFTCDYIVYLQSEVCTPQLAPTILGIHGPTDYYYALKFNNNTTYHTIKI